MPLTARQLRAIDVLLTARSQAAAARRLKMDRKTLRRWLQDPEFRRELSVAQRQAVAQNVRGVAGMAGDAIKTLRALMANAVDEEIKLKAAQEALERLFDADLVMRTDEGSQAETLPGTS